LKHKYVKLNNKNKGDSFQDPLVTSDSLEEKVKTYLRKQYPSTKIGCDSKRRNKPTGFLSERVLLGTCLANVYLWWDRTLCQALDGQFIPKKEDRAFGFSRKKGM